MAESDARAFDEEAEASRVADCLHTLKDRSGADAVLIVDRSGAVAAHVGDEGIDAVAMGSLASAHFAAGHRLASLVGGIDLSALVHQGDGRTIVVMKAPGDRVVAVVHSAVRAPRRIVADTETGVAQLESLLQRRGAGTARKETVDEGWTLEAADEIDRIFGDGA